MQAIGCVSRKSSAAANVSLPVSVGRPVYFRCHLPCSKLSVDGRKSPGSIWYWPMGSKVFRTCRMPDKWTHLAGMLLAIPSRTVRGSKPQSIPAPSLTSLDVFGPHVAKSPLPCLQVLFRRIHHPAPAGSRSQPSPSSPNPAHPHHWIRPRI